MKCDFGALNLSLEGACRLVKLGITSSGDMPVRDVPDVPQAGAAQVLVVVSVEVAPSKEMQIMYIQRIGTLQNP